MNTYIETTLDDINSLFVLDRMFLSPFIFRGQIDVNWSLTTSIERISRDFSKYKHVDGYSTEEKWMLHEFTRRFHLYSNTTIPSKDYFEWLAVMQHYGTPTRLLDFTRSIFIATYFAVIISSTDSIIWAVNRHKLRDNLNEKYNLNYTKGFSLKDEVNQHHISFANQFIASIYDPNKTDITTVIPLEPQLCNERLTKQQGLFLMPTNCKMSFMDNLQSAFNKEDSYFEEISFDDILAISEEQGLHTDVEVIKIIIPSKLRSKTISLLNEMNITSETLFPGLDGLAKSLIQTQVFA